MATTVKDSVSAPMYFAPAARPMSTPRGTARRGVGARNNLINMARANTEEGSEKVVLLKIGASSRDCLNLGVFIAKSAEQKINSTQRGSDRNRGEQRGGHGGPSNAPNPRPLREELVTDLFNNCRPIRSGRCRSGVTDSAPRFETQAIGRLPSTCSLPIISK